MKILSPSFIPLIIIKYCEINETMQIANDYINEIRKINDIYIDIDIDM